jgi:hypothetical protein
MQTLRTAAQDPAFGTLIRYEVLAISTPTMLLIRLTKSKKFQCRALEKLLKPKGLTLQLNKAILSTLQTLRQLIIALVDNKPE